MIKTASRGTVAAAILMLGASLASAPLFAQTATTTAPATAAPHKNMIQKHPYATGIVAGIATHHALKVAAARDKRSGKKLNWAERHPTLSGLGVGAVTTHEVKAHTPKTTQ